MQKRAEKPEWRRIAEEFEASALTQREFAGRRGLGLSTLQSWVYRRMRQESAGVEPPVRLVPVQVGSAPVSDEVALEGGLPRGVRVQVTSGTDVDSVARLVAALERAAC